MTDNLHAPDLAAVAEIDISGFQPAQLVDQPQPQLLWVPVARLVIDRRYQRSITAKGRGAIQRIANSFDWRRYHPILIAPHTGGRFAVVDGQHRAHAAALCGIEELPGMVVPMSLAEQARSFVAVNTNSIALSKPAIYRAALAAGEPWALRCREVAEGAGVSIATTMPNSTLRKPAVLYTTTLIRRMIDHGEEEAVSVGLAAIARAQTGDQVENWSNAVLTGWLSAIASNQRFLRLNLPAIFDGIDMEGLRAEARVAARQHGTAFSAVFRARLIGKLAAHLQAEAV